MSTDSRLVVLFGLEECNTGTEMLEYIDSLAQENDADWLVVTLRNPLGWHLGGYMLLCSYIRIDSVWAVACCWRLGFREMGGCFLLLVFLLLANEGS